LGEEAFANHAAARRAPLHTFDRPQASRTGMRPDDVPAIARWIESLPKPVGIIADCDGLSSDEVANATDLSRRSLERQFAKLLGRSIHDEIVKTKLIAARRLLAETDLKLAAIAAPGRSPAQ
jgi:transcriptional regulator GlxA family with amidase domain